MEAISIMPMAMLESVRPIPTIPLMSLAVFAAGVWILFKALDLESYKPGTLWYLLGCIKAAIFTIILEG
jgi:hypothetical protein